ncbi:MAG TPA: S1/P1 nuclease [Flavisolibacter sp.]|nr:S1/P1 nuclease [Flavisolibacter sp.]
MRKRFFATVFFLVFLFYIPLPSMAWGMLGHRIVGEIADKYLTAKTKAEIKKILGNESIAMTSNWADFIKSDTNFRYLNSWHYINFEKGLSYGQMKDYLKNDTAVDAYTRLNFLRKELKKRNLTGDKKLMYLRLLIHIAEDLSQPLHVSPVGTTGGNDIKVNWFGQTTNLHSVWDSYLIEHQQLSYTEYVAAINFPTAAQKKTWINQPVTQWLFDSYTIAQKLHEDITVQNPRLGYEYNFRHLSTLNEQLLKGGLRLAGLLNSIYDK